jgi:hypothetical protein
MKTKCTALLIQQSSFGPPPELQLQPFQPHDRLQRSFKGCNHVVPLVALLLVQMRLQ